MNKETKREIIKYTLMGVALVAVAVYIWLLVFVAAPDFSKLPTQ
jgi:hypothetical protein